MIYLFAGDDTKAKLLNYEKFYKTISKNAETFFISRNDFNHEQIANLTSGAGLFFVKSVVVFSDVLDRAETRDFILDKLNSLQDSKNEFIFVEGKLTKPTIDAFKKARAELNIFELPKEKKERYDNFKIANAFAMKDKFMTWQYLREAIDLSVGLEEVVGVLFWKIKDMLIRRNFGKFTELELQTAAMKLSYLLPAARTRGDDAESALEEFVLEAF